jgi:hypothetical protein
LNGVILGNAVTDINSVGGKLAYVFTVTADGGQYSTYTDVAGYPSVVQLSPTSINDSG